MVWRCAAAATEHRTKPVRVRLNTEPHGGRRHGHTFVGRGDARGATCVYMCSCPPQASKRSRLQTRGVARGKLLTPWLRHRLAEPLSADASYAPFNAHVRRAASCRVSLCPGSSSWQFWARRSPRAGTKAGKAVRVAPIWSTQPQTRTLHLPAANLPGPARPRAHLIRATCSKFYLRGRAVSST